MKVLMFRRAALLLPALLWLLSAAGCEKPAPAEASREVPRNVRVLAISQETINEYFEISGPVLPVEGADLSAQENGPVVALPVAKGDAVAAGQVIVEQERTHAVWVAELLAARGLPVEIEEKAERYWPALMEVIEDLETGCAVGAHAEEMRLRRIEAIAGDPEAPADVRACFQRILPEERFHARAFAKLAGETALDKTNGAHEAGLRALGLVA